MILTHLEDQPRDDAVHATLIRHVRRGGLGSSSAQEILDRRGVEVPP